MTEVVISIVSKISEYWVAPAVQTGYYLFCVGKLTKKLEKEKRKLTSTKDVISQRAEEAKRKTERIENAVEEWLQEVRSLLQDVENLEKEVRANGCFWNLCPTWRRYRLCEQLGLKIERIIELNNNSKFEWFSRLASFPTNITSSANVMLFKSTQLGFDQLLDALKDDGCHIICLYGMGGCGKTTLAKEVGKRALELKLFDKVVFTTLSQTPNVRKVQGDIADVLGLSPLKEENEVGRAQRLSLGLQSGGRILVIMDDVWGLLNLSDYGIPLDGNLKGCKILLTTRLQQLCSWMNGQRNVHLQLLSTEEAWAFFQKKACITEDSSSINIVAQEIAAECKGLPIAIQAMATTLKGNPLHCWKDALYKLRHSELVGVPQGVTHAFTCFQYSYDALTNEEAKRLFLMCSIFPEDHEMEREDLFRYGVGLGLFGDDDSFDDLRSRVDASLTNLLHNSLLMHCGEEEEEDYFRIHDVVRDFAIWKSSKMDWFVMVDHIKGINSLALDGPIKNCFAVSSWCKREDDQFPHQFDSPKLEILLLNSNSPLDLSLASFEGIQRLKTMALIGDYRYTLGVSLPQSTQWLTNLRTLRLVKCKLGDISFVVCLERLEILDLHKSKFELLPKGIEKLRKLKLLDLRECEITENCDEIIIKCSQLEEFYVYGVDAFSGKYFIYSHTCLLEDVSFPKLQRYTLQIGKFQAKEDIPILSSVRAVHLGQVNISTLNTFVKDLLERAKDVYLENIHGGCKSIFPELVAVARSMNQLTNLRLDSCSEIESILCLTPTQAYYFQADLGFPMLVEYLRLSFMDNLKQVCHGPLPPNIFQNLKKLDISNCCKLMSIFPKECNMCNLKELYICKCPMLTSLLPMSVARTLSQLEVIEIRGCDELRHIVMDEGRSATDKREEILHASNAFDFMFPKLKTLTVLGCKKLQYVLRIPSTQRPMQELEKLTVDDCSELKFIIFNEEEDSATAREQNVHVFENSSLAFPKLHLCVSNCGKLEYVFHIYCAKSLVQLQRLEIESATQIKYVFGKDVADDHSANQNKIQILFPQLERISLENLKSLVKICSENCYSSWPSLKHINWSNCPKLKNLEVETIGCERSDELLPAMSIINLKDIEICNCGVVNIPLPEGDDLKNNQQELATSKLKFVNFEYLEKIRLAQCEKLKCVFPAVIHCSFPHLTTFDINNCENLEQIFEKNEEHQNPCRAQECFPKLGTLRVKRCNKLKAIFSVRIARSFPCLETLCISEALELKEIFKSTNEGISNSEKEILVPTLKKMNLEKLPSLIDICQGFTFVAVELRHVQICDCPKFALISEAARYWKTEGVRIVVVMNESPLSRNEDPTLPLTYIWSRELDDCGVIDIFQIDGSVSVSGDDQHQVMIDSQVVRLRCEHDLWRGPIPTKMLSLQYLERLTVRRCGKLKCLFPKDVIQESLPKLVFLTISDCEEMEQVIAEEEEGEQQNACNNPLSGCFPKLRELEVERCNKLKRLFPATTGRELPQLQVLLISDAAELEELFGRESDGKKIVLPELAQLTLLGLPRLVRLRDNVIIPKCKRIVRNCPLSGFPSFPF